MALLGSRPQQIHIARGTGARGTVDHARKRPALGLETREILVLTLLTFLVIATTTAVHLSHVMRLTLEETFRRAELLARQLDGLSVRALSRAADRDPMAALKERTQLQSFLDSTARYSPEVLYITLEDETGRAILHSDPTRQGTVLPERPRWNSLLSGSALRRVRALYGEDQIYEVVMPVSLDRRPVGSIKIGLSLTRVKNQLYDSLWHSAIVGAVALLGAWAAAVALSRLTLKPIRFLAEDMKRLRGGELDLRESLSPNDEFGRLAAELRLLGQELHSDRAEMHAQISRYQHVVDHVQDGLVFFDADQRLQLANRAADLILGRSTAEAKGTPLKDLLEVNHPVRRLLEQALEQAANVQSASLAITTEGATTEYMVSVFPVLGGARGCDGALVLMKDLKSPNMSARTVQSLIAYSTHVAALAKAASEVTHEVKNPLNAMAIHLRLLQDQLSGAPESVRKSLDVIQKQITRLDSVVQGFMDLIRPQRLTVRPVDLRALLKDVSSLLEAEWREKGVVFTLGLDAELPSVSGDEDALRTVFMNIVLNACQAMPAGGTVTIAAERLDDGMVAVTVSDTGAGIRPEDMTKIFSSSFTTKPDGSGIGLALVRRVIELHGAEMEISSRVGHGTTVVIRLSAA